MEDKKYLTAEMLEEICGGLSEKLDEAALNKLALAKTDEEFRRELELRNIQLDDRGFRQLQDSLNVDYFGLRPRNGSKALQ